MSRGRTWLTGVLLAARCAYALNPALDVSQYAHTAWKIRDGFAKGAINSIAQTPDGYLWLGTDSGLLRFDGVRNVVWQPPAEQHLPSSIILNLLTAHDGTLWIGTRKGLASWKNGKLSQFAELDGDYISALLEDREGSVWAGTSEVAAGKLCAIQSGRVRCYGNDGRFGHSLLSLYEYRGNLWVGASSGLWRWKPDPPQVHRMPGPVPEIHDLIAGDNGALWIAMRDGMRQFVDGKPESSPVPGGAQFNPHSLLRDREGGLWIGTSSQGLWHVHQGRTDAFTSADGLSGDTVQSLLEDREGNVWAATLDGLDRFRDLAAPTISPRQGLSSVAVGAVLAARDGSVWVGTTDGLNRWNNGQVTVYRKQGGRLLTRPARQPAVREINDAVLPDNAVASLFQDDQGRIWVATYHGVAWFEDGRFTAAGGGPNGIVHSIAQEGKEDIWVNHQDRGLFHLVKGSVAEAIPWSGLGLKDFALPLIEDRAQGGLWLGLTHSGVSFLKNGKVRASYGPADGLGSGAVTGLQLDPGGTLWAATEGGLSRLKNGRIATLTSKNGLPCDAVQWMIQDDSDSFWLYQPCGLVRVPRADMDAWAADPKLTIRTTVFDGSDGVRMRALPAGYSPLVTKSTDGKLWFVTYGGVGVIDPSHLPFNKLPPPVDIETVKVNGKEVAADEGMKLSHRNNDLEIDYTALSLTIPERVRFRYRLEGKDTEWQDVGSRRQAFYGGLAPKKYRFRVMASNNDGVWNEAGAAWNFSITPAYYQTVWFQGLCVLAAAGLTWLLYRLRLRQVAARLNLRMEERVNERTRIARDLHDTMLQSFQGVLLKFHAVTFALPDRPAEARKSLESAIEQARQAIAEGRDAVQGLRSSVVVTNDLARAITTFGEGLVSSQDGRPAPDFRVLVGGVSRDLAPLVRDELYRISGEALRNAFRHAGARRVEVEIHYDARRLRMRVRDDGKGIDPQVLDAGGRSGHHGLPGMRERADLVGGKLAVWSELDSGTEIELTIPSALAYAKAQAIKVAGQGNLRKG